MFLNILHGKSKLFALKFAATETGTVAQSVADQHHKQVAPEVIH